jgi:hypothetical protein
MTDPEIMTMFADLLAAMQAGECQRAFSNLKDAAAAGNKSAKRLHGQMCKALWLLLGEIAYLRREAGKE